MVENSAVATRRGTRSSSDKYWAKDSPEDLISHLISRREDYYRFIDSSYLFERIIRLWMYYHNLYYDDADRTGSDMEIGVGGAEGELSLMSVNHLRSIIHLLVTYITKNPPAWDTMATNADHRSLQQAVLGNQILDDYMDRKRVESKLKRAAEHALVFTAGYTLTVWDEDAGNIVMGDESDDRLYYEGDVRYENPTIFDVIVDLTIKDWRDHQWFLVRRQMNKWDLAAKYPKKKDGILAAAQPMNDRSQGHRFNRIFISSEVSDDQVDVWNFYHMPTRAMPMGRHFMFVGGETWLTDDDFDHESPPVHRVTPAEMLLTGFGYTVGFDLAGPQELLNGEFSTVATNHNNFGQLKIWLKTGNQINAGQLDAGMSVIECEDKPEVLNLLQTPEEIYRVIDLVVGHMEGVSGLNSVARGNPDPNLKSGTALAVVDQKATQSSSPFQSSFYEHMSDVGTATLRILKKKALSKRVISIAGVYNRSKLRDFWAPDISAVDRVRVVPGSDFLRHASGRYQMAELMAQNKYITNKEEILTLMDTGRLEPLTRADNAQLQIIHEENDVMEQGQVVEALVTDNHVLHVREHHGALDSLSKRRDPVVLKNILAHIKHHMTLFMDPEAQVYQAILNYSAGMPFLGAGMMEDGGGPGQGQVPQRESPPLEQIEGQAPPGMRPEAVEAMKDATVAAGIA